jgi:hypothetical protein
MEYRFDFETIRSSADHGDTCECCGRYTELYHRISHIGPKGLTCPRFVLWLCDGCVTERGIVDAYQMREALGRLESAEHYATDERWEAAKPASKPTISERWAAARKKGWDSRL